MCRTVRAVRTRREHLLLVKLIGRVVPVGQTNRESRSVREI